MGRLDGRVAIVTGGARGIGVHYVRALAAEGARLMTIEGEVDVEPKSGPKSEPKSEPA